MVQKNITALNRSVIFRLLIWYSFILFVAFSGIFTLLFVHVADALRWNSIKELEAEAVELVSVYYSEGIDEFKKGIVRAAHTHGTDDLCYSLFDPNGSILFTSDMSHWRNLPVDYDLLAKARGQKEAASKTVRIPGIYPDVQVVYVRLEPDKILRVASVLQTAHAFLSNLQKNLAIAAIVVWIAIIAVGWATLRRVIGKVTNVTNTALSVSSTSLSKRVPLTSDGDEIDDLVRAFNGMLNRIEALVNGLNEVTDNVAHDLKSPLTRIRLIAESLLKTSEADAPANEIAGQLIEESDRLLEMINTALEIKSIDTGISAFDFTRVDIADIVRQACDLFDMAAEEKGVTLHMDGSGPIVINGDLHRLQRAFANLIDNAVKYTNAGGKIDVRIQSDQTNVRVMIADTGVGIAAESLERVFERFYRADKSRNIPGLGLGLSLAESIVKAHGGAIQVESTVAIGSTFTVILPCDGGQSERLSIE